MKEGKNKADFWKKALYYADKNYDTFCFFTNNEIGAKEGAFPVMLALGSKNQVKLKGEADAFQKLETLHNTAIKPIFGFLGYDLKNQLENVCSHNTDFLSFPDIYFSEPEILISEEAGELLTDKENFETVQKIEDFNPSYFKISSRAITVNCRFSREEYIKTVKKLQEHIQRGDIYEANFCVEFYLHAIDLDPVNTFLLLSEISPMPFSAMVKIHNHYIICASPERYLKKTGNRLISQPIKGTTGRGINRQEDEVLKARLLGSEKEKAENIMIVDLVRNDLSKIAANGSVKVKELNKLYSFEQVHQLISTVEAHLDDKYSFSDAIKATFPMGSMTGAPKVSAMELIEKYEKTKRGVFSGAIGFITPGGDLDLNVVIRTLLYNKETGYASFQAGSAITIDADPEREWEECLIKTKAIREALKLAIK